MKKIATLLAALALAFGLVACGGTSQDNVKAQHSSHSVQNKPKANADTKPAKPKPTHTVAQEQAIGSAKDYLSVMAFSKRGLIKQLSSKYGDGFSKADAKFAVNHIKVNWKKQAAKSAREYLSTGHFSHDGLVEQLESKYGEGFTHEQAEYGVRKAGLQ